MSNASEPAVSSEGTDGSPSKTLPGKPAWVIAILVSSAVAWGIYTYPPKTWRVPDRLADVSALSPQSDQDELAAVELSNRWNNSMLKFTMAGLGLGLAGFLLYGPTVFRHLPSAIITLVCGAVAGFAAGVVGLLLRTYLDIGHPIPLITEQSRPLFCDGTVLAVVNVILLSPICVLLCMHSDKQYKQKALAVPLAGFVAGIITPIVVGLAFPGLATNIYPPYATGVTSVWFAFLGAMTLVVTVFLGNKPTSEETASSDGNA